MDVVEVVSVWRQKDNYVLRKEVRMEKSEGHADLKSSNGKGKFDGSEGYEN